EPRRQAPGQRVRADDGRAARRQGCAADVRVRCRQEPVAGFPGIPGSPEDPGEAATRGRRHPEEIRQEPHVSFETTNVWRQSTPELQAELVDFWTRHGAIADPARAALRAKQAVLVARDADGQLVGVGTALLR